MSENLFDKHVKAKLSNYASPVPEGLWEKIAQESNKKPAAIWWKQRALYLSLFLLIAASLGVYFSMNNNQQKLAQITSTPTLQVGEQRTTTLSSNKENSTTTEKLETTNIENNTVTSSNSSDNLNNSTNANTSVTLNKASTEVANNTIQSIATNKSNEKSFLKIKTNKKSTQKSFIASQHNNSFNNNSYINELAANNNYLPITNATFNKASLTSISYKLLAINELKQTNLATNLFKPKDCPSVNGDRRNDWYLETYVAPEYVLKKTKSLVASNAYLAKKDSIESMQGGYTIGARFSKNITERILLKAGVQFSQINERVTLQRENERRVITVVTIKTITDAGGNVITVSDTSTIVQVGYVITKGYNYYRNLELPVSVSYELGNKKFRTAINGGVIVNLSSWYQGKVLDTSYQLVNVHSKDNEGITKHTVGLSLYGSVSFIQSLNKTLDVFAEPFFRYNLTKLENTAYGFNQRFGALGISFGLRYKLNNNRQRY